MDAYLKENMKYNILVLFILVRLNCPAQNMTLKFQSTSGESVSFIYLFDSLKNLKAVSDKDGIILIPNSDYNFETSHVSYLKKSINIIKSKNDTVIIIQLINRFPQMEEIYISNDLQKQKWKKNEIGTFHKSGNSTSGVYHNLKTGIVFKFINEEFKTAILEKIKFKSDVNRKLISADSIMIEIKLYGIDTKGQIENEPLNKLPIYLNVKDLKRKNEIKIYEKITIPKSGLFLSFEVPQSNNKTMPILVFFGTFQNDMCNYFVRNTKELNWPPNIISDGCKSQPTSGNFFYPFISLKYKYK